MYHNIVPGFNIGGISISPAQLETQMSYLKKEGYRGVSVREYLNLSKDLKEDKIILTFDDALQGVHRYALPILKDFGFTATLFIPTNHIGKDNSWDINLSTKRFRHMDIKELLEVRDAGWEMAAHTHTHRSLIFIPYGEAEKEIYYSKLILEHIFNEKIEGFSYPFGHYNNRVKNLVKLLGFKYSCSIFSKDEDNLFTLPRTGVYSYDFMFLFKEKLKGRSFLSKLDYLKNRFGNSLTYVSNYFKSSK